MANLIFAFMQAHGGDERESVLFARSLRLFGGELANQPVWLTVPQELQNLSESTRQVLRGLGVQVHRFEVPDDALHFLFGGKVYAAAAAESLAAGQSDVLVWMDSDTVFVREPSEFVLKENISLGYRPVMLKNISLLYDEPLNPFWKFIYQQCKTPNENIFPMLTTVDGVQIRPQFNAGVTSVRPRKKLLQTWRDHFEQLYQQPELAPYYEEHILYRIFVHQAILSATLLSVLKQDEMQDLGPNVNFPMFLDGMPDSAREAVTLRYDEFSFFEKAGWEKKIDLSVPVKAWLRTQIQQ